MSDFKTSRRKRSVRLSVHAVHVVSCLGLLLACPLLLHADANPPPNAITADGGRYFGPLIDDMRQGHGRIEWSNGARYEGGFSKGLYSGRGTFQSASGYKYEGGFERGMASGHGQMEMKDGAVYVGEFRNDDFNGHGRYQMPTGDIYEGTFENGFFHGKGKLTGPRSEYQGDFRQGEYWGQGELTYPDGRKYRGQFVRGQYHGKGRFENAGGDIYEGDFDKDELTGKGQYKLRDGSRYQGSLLNWNPHGAGTFTDINANVYEGQFVNGELTGKGRMTSKDGARYEGEFRQWRFHGQGVYRYANGDEYKGSFVRGLYEGEGTLVYAMPQSDGRTRDSGIWRYGMLENKEQERQVRANVETALYNQRHLLDRALTALMPQDPKKIDMYVLTVAGDGSQEVFRREVEFVRDQFDREFGTRGRSLMLVNSRTTVASSPMATVTSIRESLKGIAAPMDKEQDILFLFLTSHGSKDHEFVLNQNGMELGGLRAAELGTVVRETGIRWKVLVISACYSGGFIDSVKDDHTLVITAARHDRSSFGCADDNDFTYFGRAFFKESLSHSGSFQDAFQKARALVEQWEAKDSAANGGEDKEGLHSLPQMHNPAAMKAYLQRWRAQQTAARPKTSTAASPGSAVQPK